MIDGKKLKALRENAGLSQSELARVVGVSSPVINRAELGIKDLSLSVAAMVARQLGCKVDDFLKDLKEAI